MAPQTEARSRDDGADWQIGMHRGGNVAAPADQNVGCIARAIDDWMSQTAFETA